ncbi:uncharacterized protein DEA37_0007421 [Paragonimus westermani]|uniref:Uncharacterized protein n=1 Tax=Paragonimus westermani TaxID=34504 RepID=A0A5J4NSQ1_9TREM|nr:uncharacterized protein DEA37_0007421 [Paragonimus westermani]
MVNKVSGRDGLYRMRFAPSNCKVLLQDWGISTPTFLIAGNPLETVDSFTYLGSIISSACNVADEISARIAKARVAFTKLRHLWRRKDVRSETWPVHEEDINRLAVFDHRCLRHLAHIKWADRVSNVVVRRRVFRNARDVRSIGQITTLHSLQWLGHILRMPAERLPFRALYTEVNNSWVKPRSGQATTWSRNMKTLTAPLSKVSYFTAIFPYILLTILLIRSLLLPGALQGIKFYLYPEFSRLLDPRVDAIIVACINCATSVYAGFVIFANLGFMAHTKNTTVSSVAKSGK